MTKTALKPFLIGLETFVFCVAIGVLFFAADRYSNIEKNVNREVNSKNDIGTTFENYEVSELTRINGAAVMTEIMGYDGSITVKVNSTVINDIHTPTGEKFFKYMKEFGPELLQKEVSITATYEKKCFLDSNGALTMVQYQII